MKNPKTAAGIAALAVLIILGIVLAANMIPTIRETRREMSLTPTPVPDYPESVMAVTRDPSAPTQAPVLRTGSKGDDVTNLQSRLKTLGYYQGEIDGQFGSGTKEAVMNFQRQNDLQADGLVGEETREALCSATAKPYAGQTEKTDTQDSSYGDE